MVKVYFELNDKDIISTSKYFNNSYTEAWLDDWAKRVIREIDRGIGTKSSVGTDYNPRNQQRGEGIDYDERR